MGLAAPQERHILEVDNDGLVLVLDDGTAWNIPAGDNDKAASWAARAHVLVESAGSCAFPYRITNLDTSLPDVVRAARRF